MHKGAVVGFVEFQRLGRQIIELHPLRPAGELLGKGCYVTSLMGHFNSPDGDRLASQPPSTGSSAASDIGADFAAKQVIIMNYTLLQCSSRKYPKCAIGLPNEASSKGRKARKTVHAFALGSCCHFISTAKVIHLQKQAQEVRTGREASRPTKILKVIEGFAVQLEVLFCDHEETTQSISGAGN